MFTFAWFLTWEEKTANYNSFILDKLILLFPKDYIISVLSFAPGPPLTQLRGSRCLPDPSYDLFPDSFKTQNFFPYWLMPWYVVRNCILLIMWNIQCHTLKNLIFCQWNHSQIYLFCYLQLPFILCSLLHLMGAIAHVHASMPATSLMHLTNSTQHFCLWNLLSRTFLRK